MTAPHQPPANWNLYIPLLSAVLAAGAAWGAAEARLSAVERRLDSEVQNLKEQSVTAVARLDRLENKTDAAIARVDASLSEMRVKTSRIETLLEQLIYNQSKQP